MYSAASVDLAQRERDSVVLPFACGHRKAVARQWVEQYHATEVKANCPDCARVIWLRTHPEAAQAVAVKKRGSSQDSAVDTLRSLMAKLA